MATQPRFKVGQMVKVIQEENEHIGKIGKVTKDDRCDSFPYRVIFSDGSTDIYDHHHLQPFVRTLESLVEGDTILDDDGNEIHVLGVIRPGLYVLEDAYHEGHADMVYTAKELEDNGYTIKQETEAVVERTVADLEKELNLAPGTLRVKADEAA